MSDFLKPPAPPVRRSQQRDEPKPEADRPASSGLAGTPPRAPSPPAGGPGPSQPAATPHQPPAARPHPSPIRPPAPPPSAPSPAADPRRDPSARPPMPQDEDDAFDAAMKAATRQGPPKVEMEAPLKKQWDDELEAELEAAMAGFDAEDMSVGSTTRDRPSLRGLAAKGTRGQEDRRGPQMGKVISIRGKSVFVDLGAKSEGIVPLEQFLADLPEVGSMIEVVADRFDPAEGILLLNLKGAAVEASWENLRKGLVVEAKVTKVNKGGLEVEVDGIRGFMPIGQIDVNRVEDASSFVGQKLKCVVTEAREREKNLVVSRRDLLEIEREEMKAKTWTELQEGQVRPGVIRSVKEYGAFVDLGGVDGLLHIGDMSWSRLTDASGAVKVGQHVMVKVLKIDRTTSKVSLGLKQLQPSPWDRVEEDFARGDTVPGKVTRLMDFGAFVELAPGIEGLIHVTELSPSRVRRIADIVKPDQEVEVRILKIEPEARKISLSLRPSPLPSSTAEPEPDDDTPPPPPKVRKVPLKGGMGDSDPKPF